LAAIVEGSNDAIFSMTLGGVIMSWNAGAERLYGYPASEIIGQHLSKLVPDSVHGEDVDILERIRRGESIDHYETVRRRKNGSIIDISLTVSPIRDRRGKVIGISKTARDISDKKRAEEVLRRQHQELAELDVKKDEFLAMLGHELRNPLAALQNASRLVCEETDEPTRRWATDVVRRQVDLLARLVDDLVDVSRITRGRIELRRGTVDVRPILRRSVETVRPLIEERQHRVEFTLPDDLLLVSADSTRLQQVLVNLVTNAAKYTDPGGLIQLSASRANGRVAVTVKDNGIGIAPDLLSRIFDLFVQDTRELDRSRGGMGIGLHVAKRLVEMQGGTLSAMSKGPGKGSEFTVILPEVPERFNLRNQPITPADHSSGNGGSSRRILLVDDNHDSARTFSRLLQRRGHSVQVAHDGPSALLVAQSFKPDTFLLDLGLPGMDGYQLAAELQRLGFDDALFIAISGYAQHQDFERSRQAGFQHHLVKPVGIDRIVDIFNSSDNPRAEVRPNAAAFDCGGA
jgi:PAS domain S-box-containing protein